MNFLSKLLQGIAFVPTVVHGIEGLFGHRSGAEKRDAALSFVSAALSMTEAVANKEIVDEEKFRSGLGQVIDGPCSASMHRSGRRRRSNFKPKQKGGKPRRPAAQLTCWTMLQPKSSDQFSRVFFTSAMNWSATAPSITRWS